MSAELSTDTLFTSTFDWTTEVLLHGNDLISGLQERRTGRLKDRKGQAGFRYALLARYDSKCVVTGNAVPEALEAAHVMPHTGDTKWDHPDNGLLLRRDIHSLFDASLWSIDPVSGQAIFSDCLKDSEYAAYDGQRIEHQVALPLLEIHLRVFREANSFW